MGKTFACFVLAAVVSLFTIPAAKAASQSEDPGVTVSFRFQEMKVMASNQFAIWVEDAKGEFIRTIFATDFTGKRGGWEFREYSVPLWVEKANVPEMADEDFDAFSGATPSSGNLSYDWDLSDGKGKKVPPGTYVICLEGTLRNQDHALYKAAVKVGGEADTINPQPIYRGDNAAVRSMIGNVTVRYIP